MPNPNRQIINSLIETLKFKVEPPKIYDCLIKLTKDFNKAYDALFDGPLPPVSGKDLDLTEIPSSNLPSNIAYINKANVFSEIQTLEGVLKAFVVGDSATSAVRGRFSQSPGNNSYVSNNLYYNGAAWVSDNGAVGSMLFQSGGYSIFYALIGGVLTQIFAANPNAGGIVHTGALPNANNLNAFDIVVPNTKKLASVNAAGTTNLSMILMDGFDLVQLGSKSAGNTNVNGSPAIPTVANADLPPTSANNNGVILIDKTNHRICWWDSGNRYYAAGTAF